jgi:hypothetical protein
VCWNSARRSCLTGNFFVFERNFFTKCNFVSAHITSFYTSSYDSAIYGFYIGQENFSENFEISLDFSESYGKLYFMIRNTEKLNSDISSGLTACGGRWRKSLLPLIE